MTARVRKALHWSDAERLGSTWGFCMLGCCPSKPAAPIIFNVET